MVMTHTRKQGEAHACVCACLLRLAHTTMATVTPIIPHIDLDRPMILGAALTGTTPASISGDVEDIVGGASKS